MITTHSAADILATYLIAAGFGSTPQSQSEWPTTYGQMPDDGNEAISVQDTTPRDDGRLMAGPRIEHPGFQIRIRSVDGFRTGHTKAKDIANHLDTVVRVTLAIEGVNYRIAAISRISGPLYLGLETGRNRHLFTINGTMTVEQL